MTSRSDGLAPALEAYRQAVALDPEAENTRRKLEELSGVLGE